MNTPRREKPYFPPRLMNALAEVCHSPVTVVSAPSGSGKTTAVKEFSAQLEKRGTRVLWYTAFGETPDTAWKQICTLLSEVDTETAALLYKLKFPVRQTLSTLARLIPQLECGQETLLVIDNAQLIKSDVSYELVRVLAQHSCEYFHVVFVTQTSMDTSTFPLGAAGILFLDTHLFFFREEDVAAYFSLNDAQLTAEQLHQVMEDTFGWTALVRLQLLNYRRTGCIKPENSINQLMRTALWEPLPADEKGVLLAVSLMESVNLQQVRILLSCNEIPDYGMRLLERGGFIQYDLQSRSYAVHSLLRSFLAPYFEQLPPEEQDLLHARAGRAYLLADRYLPALRMLMLAGECEEMLSVPFTNMDMEEYDTDEVTSLIQDILAGCPPGLLARHPVVMLRFAFEALLRGADELHAECCALVNRALKTPEVFTPKERRRLRGEYTFLRSFSVGNNLAKMTSAQKAALKALEGPSHAFDTRHCWTFGVPTILAQYWSDHAPLAETLDIVERGLPDYMALSRWHGAGAAQLIRAEAKLNAGQLNDAEALCHKARYLAAESCQDNICFGIELTLGRIAVLNGNATAYVACQENIQRRVFTGNEKARQLIADQCIAYLSMSLGRAEDIPPWLRNEKDIQNRMYRGGVGYGMLLLGKFLLLQKDYNHLLGLADSVLEMAEDQRTRLLQVYYLLYLACATQASNQPEDTQHYLQQALDIALPDAIHLPFAEHAAELEKPLAIWENMSGATKQAATIRRLAKKYSAGVAGISRTLYSTGLKLTPREAEIARYAGQGLSNKQIADALFISPETVKKTLKNVFAKLEIKSRRQLEDYELG